MFRSYLLLPTHLSPPRFGPLAHDLEPARVLLTRRLNLALRSLATVNYSKTRSRLVPLNRLEEDALGPEESALADDLAHELSDYEDQLESSNNSWLTLQALDAYSQGLPPADVNRRLAHYGWPVRAEVTARLSWISEQAARITNGVAFTAPFQCTVSDRNVPGRALDREHHQLIGYLHGLATHTGERLIPLNKGETPDFTLIVDGGSHLVGAEMAEAPVSGTWADDQDVAEVVRDALIGWLAPARRNILIDEPCSWGLWRDNLKDLEQTVCNALALPAMGKRVPIVSAHLSFRAALTPGLGTGLVMWHDPHGQGPAERSKATRALADGITGAISKKLVKRNGAPRKRPSVRPCDLVLYPNTDTWPDWDGVFQLASRQVPTGWSAYFDRIWLSSENRFGQLA